MVQTIVFLWSDIKSFSDVTHFGLTVAFPLSGQKPPERCPGPFHRPVHTESMSMEKTYAYEVEKIFTSWYSSLCYFAFRR